MTKTIPTASTITPSGERARISACGLLNTTSDDCEVSRLMLELHAVLSTAFSTSVFRHSLLTRAVQYRKRAAEHSFRKRFKLCSGPESSRMGFAWATLAALLLFSMSCSKDPEALRTAAMDETFNSLNRCAAAGSGQNNQSAEGPTIAIVSVANTARETEVRLVAYAGSAPAEFYLPVYKLSAGRWLINEKDRAFLLDEKCREFKLRDKKPPPGQKFPQDGIIRLNPGQAFEVTLSFYRLPDKTRMGMLIYAGKSLAFTVTQAPASDVGSR